MRTETLAAVELPAHSIRILRDVLDENGLDGAGALVDASINPKRADDPWLKVTGAQQVALQRAFVRQTAGREDLWARAAVRHNLQILDLIGLAFWTAPDLEAWCRLLQFSDFHYGLANHVVLRDGHGRPVGIEFVDSHDEELRDFSFVLHTASVIRGLDAVWGGAFPFERIEYPAAMTPSLLPPPRARAIEVSHSPRLLWSSATAGATLPGANPLLHQSYLSALRKKTKALRESVAPETRVQHFLALPGNSSRPLEDAARALGVSSRTLQRRLSECHISYRDMQRAARRSEAADLIEDSGLSINEISAALGYADSSSFSRAFTAWFGRSPSQHRALRARGS